MKTILKILAVLVAALVLLVVARNIVVKTAVENGVRAVTGMPLSIKKLDIDFAKKALNIEGLVVKNPEGFHDTVFVDIPKIYVDYKLSDLLKGKIHLEALEFDLTRLSVVKNEKGELNLDRLTALQKTKTGGGTPAKQEPVKKAKAIPLQIDVFRLKVGKASFIDYSGGKESVKEFNVGLDETYRDITDPNKLVTLIIFKVMMKTPLAMLSGFNVNNIAGSVSGIMGSASDLAGQAAGKAADTLMGTASTAQKLGGEAGGTVKGAAGTVTSSVKSTASTLTKKLKFSF